MNPFCVRTSTKWRRQLQLFDVIWRVRKVVTSVHYRKPNFIEQVEKILSGQRYLAGKQMTEADIRLFVTLIRFDMVYVLHFKCNRKRIVGR